MRHAVARVEDHARHQPLGVKHKRGLDAALCVREPVLLEHRAYHFDAVFDRVQGRLGHQNFVFFRVYLHALVEAIVPQVFHVFPIFHDAVFQRVS